MNPNDPNVAMVEAVAARLGALRRRMVFVGGCAAGLLITDPALPAIRATEDVDVVVEVAKLSDYHKLEKQMAAAGFERDMREGAPICRWRLGEAVLDLMPVDKRIPLFIATKLEAFLDRGKGDFLMSHDLGDALAVIDGRETLLAEFEAVDAQVAGFVGDVVASLLATQKFASYLRGRLPGDAASQARLPELEAKLARIAELAKR